MYTFFNHILTLVSKPAYAQFFGGVNPPPGVQAYRGVQGQGLLILLNNLMKLLIIASGIYAILNIIIAGYDFMNAGGDSSKVNKAFDKIWQSAMGLVIAGGSFVIAGVLGQVIFGNWRIILSPEIYGP